MTLPVREVRVAHFRSLEAIAYPVSDLDVFVGANGVGKTNLYRALELIQSAAANTLARDLSREGGLESTLWAGPRRRSAGAEMRLSVGLADASQRPSGQTAYSYEVTVGFPPAAASAAFQAEPQIRAEEVTLVGQTRRVRLVDRDGRVHHAGGWSG